MTVGRKGKGRLGYIFNRLKEWLRVKRADSQDRAYQKRRLVAERADQAVLAKIAVEAKENLIRSWERSLVRHFSTDSASSLLALRHDV